MRNPGLLLKSIYPEDQRYLMECYEELMQDNKKKVAFRILLPGKKERTIRLKTHLFTQQIDCQNKIVLSYTLSSAGLQP